MKQKNPPGFLNELKRYYYEIKTNQEATYITFIVKYCDCFIKLCTLYIANTSRVTKTKPNHPFLIKDYNKVFYTRTCLSNSYSRQVNLTFYLSNNKLSLLSE